MWDFFQKLLSTEDFPARWYCGNWTTGHGHLHIISDLAVFGAYLAIPLLIVVIGSRHRQLLSHPLAWLFAAFILCCGLTHLLEASLFWQPWYRLSGVVKALTAIVSWATVIALVRVIPLGLALPEKHRRVTRDRDELQEKVLDRNQQLEVINRQLQEKIQAHLEAEARLEELNAQLEQRIEERTIQLAERELWYRTLTESLPHLVWTANAAGGVDYVSPQWLSYTGRQMDALLGWQWLNQIHPQDRDQVQRMWIESLDGGKPLDVEVRIQSDSGDSRWYRIHTVPLRDSEGAISQWFGTCTDIDEEIRLQNELVASENRLRSALINAPIPMMIHDEHHRMLELSTGWIQCSGYAREEMVTIDRWAEKAFGDRSTFVIDYFNAILRNQVTRSSGEWAVRAKDGSIRIWDIHTSPLGRSIEGSRLMISVAIDLTDRKEAERELKESEEQFRVTFEQAAVGIAQVSAEGQFLKVNQKLCQIVGYEDQELLKKTFQEITHPEDLEADLNLVRNLLAGIASTYSLEKRYIRRDGKVVWVLLTVSLVRTSEGHPRYFVAIMEDIAKRKEAEEALLQLNLELEDRIQQRTAELEAINRDLVAKNQENEMFVFSVSHDLRSPLVNLQGFSRELRLSAQDFRELLNHPEVPDSVKTDGNRILDEDFAESLHYMEQGVLRLSHIIDALLRLSRVGRLEYQWKSVDLNDLVSNIVDSRQGTITEGGVTMSIQRLPHVWGDQSALAQLFDNLIGNALKYLRKDKPGMITLVLLKQEYGFCTIAVRDNGLGIPVAAQQSIFRAFQRAHPDHAEGEGLGLAIVQRIVDRHGGRIKLESTEGEGTTFIVTLPTKPFSQAAPEIQFPAGRETETEESPS